MAIRFPLSMNQEFVCLFDQGGETGPFSSRYHATAGWRIIGKLDIGALQGALDDTVIRHEALRTLIIRQNGSRYQEVYPERPVKMIVRQLPGDNQAARKREAERLLSDAEADAISPQEVPLFRCVLGQFDDEDAALVIIAHHLATDGWSLELMMRDIALRYAARCGHEVPALPEVKQYREHVAREQESSADETLAGSLAYWQERLRGARIFTVRTDWPRSAGPMPSTTGHRFLVEPKAGSLVQRLARSMRGSPFMVLLAAFNLLACRMSGTHDITVPTFTPGRSGELFADTVGSFFNFLPLRTDISDCATFREVLQRTRDACVSTYPHDIAQAASAAPELMGPAFDEQRATCVFQIIAELMLDREKIGDMTYYPIRRQLDPQELTSDIPDGMLWTLRVSRDGEIFGDVRFKNSLFKADTVDKMIAAYEAILRTAMGNPDAPLDEIQLPLLYAERPRLDANATAALAGSRRSGALSRGRSRPPYLSNTTGISTMNPDSRPTTRPMYPPSPVIVSASSGRSSSVSTWRRRAVRCRAEVHVDDNAVGSSGYRGAGERHLDVRPPRSAAVCQQGRRKSRWTTGRAGPPITDSITKSV